MWRPCGGSTSSVTGTNWVVGSSAATAAHSTPDSSRAVSFAGQLTRMAARIFANRELLGGKQPPEQGFLGGVIPLSGPDEFLHDDTIPVDHEGLWHTSGLVRVLDAA